MTIAVPDTRRDSILAKLFHRDSVVVHALIAGIIGIALALVFDWARGWPQEWVIPVKAQISAFFTWLDKQATLGLFTVKQFTRTIAWLMKQPLLWTEFLLWKGAKVHQLLPVLWQAIAFVAAIIVYRMRDLKTAVLVAGAILGIVLIDALPLVLQSLTKSLRIDPWMEPQAFTGLSQLPADMIEFVFGTNRVRAFPWIAVVLGFGIFGHWVGGWRLAIIVTLCMSYLAFTGLWRESMKTFSLVVVAVPFSAILGLVLGVWVTRSERAAKIITPLFDLMQATPHLAYLVPVVVMFGAGQVPALIATMIFAMPPMARCTILAIQTVPSDITESGHMSGCTPRQLLWKVQLPSGQKTLLLGLNQVIMQTLAMVVICSLVGAQGLGHKLLFSLQQLKLGFATMQGVAIVLMAVVLDQITQAYAQRSSDYVHHDEQSFWNRHAHLVIFAGVLVASIIAAYITSHASTLGRDYLLFDNRDALELDKVIKATTFHLIDFIKPIRDFLTVYTLIPMRDFYHLIPWTVVIGVIGVVSHKMGGWKLAALNVGLLFFIILAVGNWTFSVTTFYFVTSALVICVLIGVPLGIWCARNERVARVVMLICDTLQTFPSFIYLVPAIMLFRVGELAIIFAIIPYATVPAIRFTYLGLKQVPPVTVEAAIMSGATPAQRLWKVELPVAIPEIMLGINQTIMMALAMTAITALIGGQDLGQEIYRALPTSDAGRGVMAGLGIASLGIVGDRLIGSWANKRKAELGVG